MAEVREVTKMAKAVEMVVLVTLLMLVPGGLIITIGLVLRNYWRKRASARRAAPLLLNPSRAITAVETISNTPVPNTPEPYNAPSTASNTPRLTDPYQQAGEEVLSGKVDAAIWARALVEGAGNDGAVKAAYVKLRVAQLEAKAEAVPKAEAKVWAEVKAGADARAEAAREIEKHSLLAPLTVSALALIFLFSIIYFIKAPATRDAALFPSESPPAAQQTPKPAQVQAVDPWDAIPPDAAVSPGPALGAPQTDEIKPTDMVHGSPSAPVTIIEYASMTCPHCAAFAIDVLPELKREYIDTGKVKLIFREYPLDGAARIASAAARCFEGEAALNFIDLLFRNQTGPQGWIQDFDGDKQMSQQDIEEGMARMGRMAGMGREQIIACTRDPAKLALVDANWNEGQTRYNVASTPTFLINGDTHSGALSFEAMKQVIDPLLSVTPPSRPSAVTSESPPADQLAPASANTPPPSDTVDTEIGEGTGGLY